MIADVCMSPQVLVFAQQQDSPEEIIHLLKKSGVPPTSWASNADESF